MNLVQQHINEALQHLKIEALNDLQKQTVESLSESNQLILSATGSGKTLAFLLPLRLRLQDNLDRIQALIIVPTRELAIQVENVMRQMRSNFKILNCYGGHSFKIEQKSFSPLPSILIGTPGRICDHIERSNLDLSTVDQIVIDEYDKCLEFGFEDQMGYIFENCRPGYTTLVSATQLKTYPAYLSFKHPKIHDFLDNVKELKHNYFKINKVGDDNFDVLANLISSFQNEQSIVFCNLRESTETIKENLLERDISAVSYHGGLEQDERERALFQFRNGSFITLICTDLGSRGLDIPDIRNVIHFELPPKEDVFIHRSGRTARVNEEGNVFVFLDKNRSFPFSQNLQDFQIPTDVPLPQAAKWITLYMSGGKKDKINKIDIVGFLIQKGKLDKSEVGLIHVGDHLTYVAVDRTKVDDLLSIIQNEKIKGQKLKINIART
ncbi:MAG: DEAD/DEAH box helicase [Bacteroidota bacterium]